MILSIKADKAKPGTFKEYKNCSRSVKIALDGNQL